MCRVLLTLVVVLVPAIGHAERVDITDPAVLGDVRQSVNLTGGGIFDYENIISEVRYTEGVYSYVYYIQSSPYFPSGWGLNEGEAELLSFSIAGGSISRTAMQWGAINDGAVTTNAILDINPMKSGFMVIPDSQGGGTFTMMYLQSTHAPKNRGVITYDGRAYCYTEDFCIDDTGALLFEYGSRSFVGAYVPTPEPMTLLLFGAGLAGLSGRVLRRSVSGPCRGRVSP
jgi:hypothetical protein